MSLASTHQPSVALPRGYAWLAANALERNVFFDPAILQPALDQLADDRVQLCVASDRETAIALAALPLVRATGRYGPVPTPVPLLVWHHPYSMVGNPLISPEDPAGALDALFAKATRLDAGANTLLLPMIPTSGAFWPLLQSVVQGTARRCHVLAKTSRAGRTIKDPTDTQASRLFTKKTGQSLRASRKKLARHGAVADHAVTGAADMPDALSAFFNLEAAGWKGRQGTALASAGHDAFARQCMMSLAETGRARVDLTLLDERPVAATMSIRSGSNAAPIWMPWKTAYDEAYAACAPGAVNLGALTQSVLDMARQTGTPFAIDSLAGQDSVIANRLWRDRVDLVDVLVDLTPGGGAAFTPILLAETARRRAIAAAKLARRAIRSATKRRPIS